ncbi:MAG TPA: serine/threonine-protein kinase [Polyangiaceae bacterium]|nr:serine/threonine-protein kinase [Polyangiaceae bacterium]
MLAQPTSPRENSVTRPEGHDRRHLARGDVVAHKYRLERLLDEGGMGSVWDAHNVDLDVSVALKLLRPNVEHSCARDRMRREARVEARLEHRAIVRVFDCGETEDGVPFIAMELLEGMCLADALEKNGPMRAIEAVRTLLPIIDGLGAAHEQGIVHRDVKPANIFLAQGARGLQPKIVDFGIATSGEWGSGPEITLEGTVMGSPAYMAPEQARGLSDVDHRADIWAVSAVLYEAVTHSPPFHGESFDALLRSIIRDEVTPSRGPEIRGLWPILARGLAKDRERRFQSMRQLGSALAQFLLDRGVADDATGESLACAWGHDGASTRQEVPAARRPSPRPSIAHMPSRYDLTPARRAPASPDEALAKGHSCPPVSKSRLVTRADAPATPTSARSLRLSVAALALALAALFVAFRRNGDPVPNAQAAAADVVQTATAPAGVASANVVPKATAPVVVASVAAPLPEPAVTPVAAAEPPAPRHVRRANHRDASAALGLKAPY